MMFNAYFAILVSTSRAALLVALWALLAQASYAQGLVPLATPVKIPPALLYTTDGAQTTLDSVLKANGKDKYYLLHLWAPSCRACIPEMKQLDKIHGSLAKQGFKMLFVAQDANGGFTVPAFSRRHEIETIESYVDKGSAITNALKPAGLPTTYLATPEGLIIAYREGSMDWVNMAGLGTKSMTP